MARTNKTASIIEAANVEIAELRAKLAALQTPAAEPVAEEPARKERLPIILASKEAKYPGAMWLNAEGKIVPHTTKGARYVEFMSTLAILNNGVQIGIPADRVQEFLAVGLVGLRADWERAPKSPKISPAWAAHEVKWEQRTDENGEMYNSPNYFGAGLRAVYGEDRATPDFPNTLHVHLTRMASLLCRGYRLFAQDLMPVLVRARHDENGNIIVGTGVLPLPTMIKGNAVIFPVFNYVREEDDGRAIKAYRKADGSWGNQVSTTAYTPAFVLRHIAIGFGFKTDNGVRPEAAVGLEVLGQKLFGMTPVMPPLGREDATMRIKDASKLLQATEIDFSR